MLDANLGMNLELTGRENIMLRGLYSGLSRPNLARLEEDAAAFAGLGDFMDLPVRFYSSGMVLRLGFALATAIHPQILFMDEWLLVGDAEFIQRARHRLESTVRNAEILVLSTHDMGTIRTWCTRVLWLDQGRIRLDGPPELVVDAYVGRATLTAEAELAEYIRNHSLSVPLRILNWSSRSPPTGTIRATHQTAYRYNLDAGQDLLGDRYLPESTPAALPSVIAHAPGRSLFTERCIDV